MIVDSQLNPSSTRRYPINYNHSSLRALECVYNGIRLTSKNTRVCYLSLLHTTPLIQFNLHLLLCHLHFLLPQTQAGYTGSAAAAVAA